MISATMKSLLREVSAAFQRFEDGMIALGAERRCARRLDLMSERLQQLGGKIVHLHQRLHEEAADTRVDADLTLRESLKGLKEDIRDIRCQIASLHGAGLPGRLQRAFRRLSQIAEETYAAADRLQWEVDDHDRPLEQASAELA